MRFYFPYAVVPGREKVELTLTAPLAFRAHGLAYSFSTPRVFQVTDMKVNLSDSGDNLIITLGAFNDAPKQWRLRAYVYDSSDPMASLSAAEDRLATYLREDHNEEDDFHRVMLQRKVEDAREKVKQADTRDEDITT